MPRSAPVSPSHMGKHWFPCVVNLGRSFHVLHFFSQTIRLRIHHSMISYFNQHPDHQAAIQLSIPKIPVETVSDRQCNYSIACDIMNVINFFLLLFYLNSPEGNYGQQLMQNTTSYNIQRNKQFRYTNAQHSQLFTPNSLITMFFSAP